MESSESKEVMYVPESYVKIAGFIGLVAGVIIGIVITSGYGVTNQGGISVKSVERHKINSDDSAISLELEGTRKKLFFTVPDQAGNN